MKKNKWLLSVVSCVVGLSLLFPVVSFAATNGGGVQTNGVIEILEDYQVSSSSDSSDSSSYSSDSSSSQRGGTLPPTGGNPTDPDKPRGKYPSTGELIKASLSISGIVLLLLGMILLLWKKRTDKENSI